MKTLPSSPPLPHLVALPGATALFEKLCKLDGVAALLQAKGYGCCWTRVVTTFAMMVGHLSGNSSLLAVLSLLRSGIADGLAPVGRRVSEMLIECVSTASFTEARSRLPLTWLRRMLGEQATQLRALAGGWTWRGLFVHVVDGTMMTMRPYGRIPKFYPPHSNQHGKTYWCQMRVLACMCLGTGLILNIITGNAGDSEQAQIVRLILFGASTGWPAAAAGSILWMGDANFGVWRVVAAAQQSGQHSLVRLTITRATKLARDHGRKLADGLDLAVSWEPSRYDQVDRGLKPLAVQGRLIVKMIHSKGYRPVQLLLFTTVEAPAVEVAELVALYLQRWRIELSLRHFKAYMGIGELKAKSPDMAKRELLTGVLAYNLVRGLMLISAARHGQKVWELSFALARQELAVVLMKRVNQDAEQAMQSWEKVLYRLSKGRLPRRKVPRPTEPRRKRHRGETFPPLHGDRQAAREQAKLEQMKKSDPL